MSCLTATKLSSSLEILISASKEGCINSSAAQNTQAIDYRSRNIGFAVFVLTGFGVQGVDFLHLHSAPRRDSIASLGGSGEALMRPIEPVEEGNGICFGLGSTRCSR